MPTKYVISTIALVYLSRFNYYIQLYTVCVCVCVFIVFIFYWMLFVKEVIEAHVKSPSGGFNQSDVTLKITAIILSKY